MPTATKPKTEQKIKELPPWNVILLNDNQIPFDYVLNCVVRIVHLPQEEAFKKTQEAHNTGQSILVTTHMEKAELFKEGFDSCTPKIPARIEPA